MSTESENDRSDILKVNMSVTEEQDAANEVSRSSSASVLSSPPHSSPEPEMSGMNDSILSTLSTPSTSHTITVNNAFPHSLGQPGPLVPSSMIPGAPGVPEKPPRKKPGRKPKPIDPNDPNPPKPRKPRVKKDPNAPIIRRGPRKSKGLENGNAVPVVGVNVSGVAGFAPPADPNFMHMHPASGNLDTIHNAHTTHTQPQQVPVQSFFTQPPPPNTTHHHHIPQPVRTSGQNYDPIRSNYVSHGQGSPQPPSMNRASASPSISSLVDPPNQALTSPSIAAQSFFNQQHQQQQLRMQRDESQPSVSVPPSPNANRLAPSVSIEPASVASHPPVARPVPSNSAPLIMSKKANGSTTTSSATASPKPPKLKESKSIYPVPPPLPGSGLMQLGGVGSGPNDGTEFRAPTIVLDIPMNGETNAIINFSKMAEEKYGWDALHPRLAAQRDRLARVAAAGAAIERNGSARDSGDDMMTDSENENSNVEMGGMSDGRTGTDGGVKKIPRKRKMKEDEYDKEDGFVDDTELAWEEQAAAVNDGFFVYSGPLVPEGEKPALDRGDGPPKRGRGRGRGGASGRGRGASALAGVAGVNLGRPTHGPGSRGGSTTRKPRITKADRARMEQEKKDREQMGAMNSMPGTSTGNYGTTAAHPLSASMGNTPLVFNQ